MGSAKDKHQATKLSYGHVRIECPCRIDITHQGGGGVGGPNWTRGKNCQVPGYIMIPRVRWTGLGHNASFLQGPNWLLRRKCHYVLEKEAYVQIRKFYLLKILIIFLPNNLNMCFGCSKELSHWDGSFEYPQHMFWMRNKENDFPIHTLIWRPEEVKNYLELMNYLWPLNI